MKKSLIETFMDLVKIDSPSGFEGEIVNFVSENLKKAGAIISIDNTGNLLAKIKGYGKPVMLSAHLDTVEPGTNIKPIVRNGTIRSSTKTILGADNKVFIAAVLDAINEVGSRKNLEIVFSVREETDGGIKKFDFRNVKSTYGIMADTGEPIGTIITSAPWIEEFTIQIIGKSAHSSVPEDGINALKIAANVISNLNIGKIDDETTINIGIINGGHVVNSVLGNISLKGELRSYSKKKFDKYSKELKESFRSEVDRFKGQMNYSKSLYSKGYRINGDGAFKEEIYSIYKRHKVTARECRSMGGSDANTFYENGIKLLNLGDGANEVHAVTENVKVKDLLKLRDIVASFICV